ncbi:T9SS type A sorting domain-containing protein [Aestuariivivens sediminis]|uniref:T9SS type A sorting domain-containing protein n=1 Tax=Aestuariivivens sediminis TaxID=2913557 RepID=UPI001F57E1FD|nr:T9SS type A sorting domain-containing protein [Aestuariivivens sediminis]
MTIITRLFICILTLILNFGMAHATVAISNTNSFESVSTTTEIQRVRVYFTSPTGLVRYLLLGFTSDDSATDGFDYGYDALNRDDLPDDLNWMIEDGRYLIQGVGVFNDSKEYPLGLFLEHSGDISIGLYATENFENPIDVYIHDTYLDTYTKITEQSVYTEEMTKGNYVDRFYIAFKDNSVTNLAKSSLSTPDEFIENTRINYLGNTKELYINTSMSNSIKSISIFNLNGQKVYTANGLQEQTIRMALLNLKGNYGIVSVESEEGFITTKQIVIH